MGASVNVRYLSNWLGWYLTVHLTEQRQHTEGKALLKNQLWVVPILVGKNCSVPSHRSSKRSELELIFSTRRTGNLELNY